jgi:hypothetical protein
MEGLSLLGVVSLDMIMGMALGMGASPLMMRAIRGLRRRRKINRLLREIARSRINDIGDTDPVPGGH